MTLVRIGTEDGVHDLGSGGTEQLAGREVTALVPDGPALWALTDGWTIWHSDGDGDWSEAGTSDLRANCLLPTADGLLVGTTEAHVLRLAGGRLEAIEAFDAVKGRDEWYTPWGGPPDTRSLAADAAGTIFANVHVGGIPRSADGGATWQPTIEVDADVHQVVAAGGFAFAACALGLAVSTDGGDSWKVETHGLHATYSRAVAVCADTVLISASRGHRGEQAAVYRRPLAGGRFERCRDGLPEWFSDNVDTHCLAAAASDVALGTRGGEVFLSKDQGGSWDLAAGDLPPVTCVAFLP
ncbi:MAG: WD40/YVTN/BNR-like repeat-containing protein [Actinomycetota bacterium]